MFKAPRHAAILDPDLLAAVASVADRKTYPAGHILATQGQLEHRFYVIERGETVVLRQEEDGRTRELDRLGPQCYFGEMGLLDESPRFATVKALTDVDVLEIDEARFAALVDTYPQMALSMVRRVLKSFRQLDEETIDALRQKNTELQIAYLELQDAQAQLVEKERLEREMELAAEMQRRLLPRTLPQMDGFSFAAHLEPARMVGGDLYDVRVLDDDHVAVLLADVADKGLQAALLMAVTRTLFFQEGAHTLSPAVAALGVHRGLLAIGGTDAGAYHDVFVTAFYGVLNRRTGILTYIRAAQDRPLLRRNGEAPTTLPGGGRFLGMLENLELEEYTLELQPGDVVLMMSDGVPEAHDANGHEFGDERLSRALQHVEASHAQQVVDGIVGEIRRWTNGSPLFDDLTLVALSYDGDTRSQQPVESQEAGG